MEEAEAGRLIHTAAEYYTRGSFALIFTELKKYGIEVPREIGEKIFKTMLAEIHEYAMEVGIKIKEKEHRNHQ